MNPNGAANVTASAAATGHTEPWNEENDKNVAMGNLVIHNVISLSTHEYVELNVNRMDPRVITEWGYLFQHPLCGLSF